MGKPVPGEEIIAQECQKDAGGVETEVEKLESPGLWTHPNIIHVTIVLRRQGPRQFVHRLCPKKANGPEGKA